MPAVRWGRTPFARRRIEPMQVARGAPSQRIVGVGAELSDPRGSDRFTAVTCDVADRWSAFALTHCRLVMVNAVLVRHLRQLERC